MKVVLIGPVHPFRGGIAHHTALLAQALEAAGHHVSVITFRSLYPAWLFPGRTTLDPSSRPVSVPAERSLRPLWPPSWLKAAKRALEARPDLVVAQWWVPYFAPSMWAISHLITRAGARFVFICHNVLPHDGGGMLDRTLVRAALGRADGWIVHSESDARALVEALGASRTGEGRVILSALPHFDLGDGVPQSAGDPTPARLRSAADTDGIRRRHGVPPDAPLLLFFGFVRPYKGVLTLIDAMPVALRSIPDLHLLIAGEFWDESGGYRRHAEAAGVSARVHFDDRYIPNEEVGEHFAASDVCVLPYREATQSGIVPQAMAAGLPVIATDVGGLPDVVDDGGNGLLVAPADPEALAAAIIRYFTEEGLETRLRAGAVGSRSRFEWTHLVATLESLAA